MKFLTLLLLVVLVNAKTIEEKVDHTISGNDENEHPIDGNVDNKNDAIRDERDTDADAEPGLTSLKTRWKLKNTGPHQFSNQQYVTPRTTPKKGSSQFSIRQYDRFTTYGRH